MKFYTYDVTFAEYPNEISLYIEISGCPNHCIGCHSPHLREDIGTELNSINIDRLIDENKGITAIVLGGGDQDPKGINSIAEYIHDNYPDIKVCWYSGKNEISHDIFIKNFDAIKIGSYKAEFGGLTSKKTNQKFYIIKKDIEETGEFVYHLEDKTSMFWNRVI